MTAIINAQHAWVRMLVCLLLLLPGFLLFLFPGGGYLAEVYWFLILVILCFWTMWLSLGQPDGAAAVHAETPDGQANACEARTPPNRALARVLAQRLNYFITVPRRWWRAFGK